MKNMLFICGRNRLRSPTAEQVFAHWPGVEVASAGVNPDAENVVTPELLEWADLIFVMEQAQRSKLAARFPDSLKGKRIVCLNIRDDYEFMEPSLVRLLEDGVRRHLPTA